jgi:hypothetical protein
MLLLRPLLVRFLSLALVVTAGAGLSARAPQAFRSWMDAAAEVTPLAARRANPRRAAHSRVAPCHAGRSGTALAALVPPHLASTLARPPAPSRPEALAPAGWPQAHSGRDVLARKRARLI